jgi:enoyl-CoA hydratase/carnithine racemase
MADSIVLDISDAVATITLNRPDVRNAFNVAMWQALGEAVEEAGGIEGVRAIVIKGAGDKAFAAGADVKEFDTHRSNVLQSQRYSRMLETSLGAIHDVPQPVIAMIRGYCVGGGCELANACDIRIAAEDARIGITPAKLGIILGFEEVRQLVALMGAGKAKELLFTGRLMDAQEALRVGWLNHVVPVDELESFTQQFVESFIHNAPLTIEAAKRAVNACLPGPDGHLVMQQIESYVRGFAGRDYQEGVASFREKRKPEFTGE